MGAGFSWCVASLCFLEAGNRTTPFGTLLREIASQNPKTGQDLGRHFRKKNVSNHPGKIPSRTICGNGI